MESSRPSSGSGGSGDSGTHSQIDLGDDLLALPAREAPIVERASGGPGGDTRAIDASEEPRELLQNARILMGEGLLEDAKRVLRRVLMIDERSVAARQRLEEIHVLELQAIFGDAEPRRRVLPTRDATLTVSLAPEPGAVDALIARLDEDLGLGLGDWQHSPTEIDRYLRRLERELADVSARDRMDVGIAYYEMGLPAVAVKQFEAAARDEELRFSATLLRALALFTLGKLLEARLALEPWVVDQDLDVTSRLHAQYLLARTLERLGAAAEASTWYARIQAIDASYRDVSHRLESLGCGSRS